MSTSTTSPLRTAGALTAAAVLLFAAGCASSGATPGPGSTAPSAPSSSVTVVPSPSSPGCYDADGHGPDNADRPCPTRTPAP